MKAFFKYISWLFFGRAVKLKLRKGALQGLRLYVNVVSGARKASMFAVLGLMGLSAITFGVFMLIGGLLWLAHLNPEAYPWIMVVTGALLTLVGVVGYIYAFRQKLWVDLSQINEFTQMALEKFPHNERPENPAVTGMWGLAAQARVREHARMETELQMKNKFSLNDELPAIEHIDGPLVARPTAPPRSSTVRIDPRMQPAT